MNDLKGEMTTEEACDVLGISPDATGEEIQDAYRHVALETHPDSQTGDRRRWDRLQEAHRVMADGNPGKELIPASLAVELVQSQERALARVDEKHGRAAASDNALKTVVRRQTSRLNERRRQAWSAGVLSAVFAGMIALLRALSLTEIGEGFDALLAGALATFGLGAAALALVGLGFRTRTERLEQTIEDLTEQLSQRVEYLRILNEIQRVGDAPPWSADELHERIDIWTEWTAMEEGVESVGSAAVEIGARDFERLFVAKGLELGLLTEATTRIDGELTISYDVAHST